MSKGNKAGKSKRVGNGAFGSTKGHWELMRIRKERKKREEDEKRRAIHNAKRRAEYAAKKKAEKRAKEVTK